MGCVSILSVTDFKDAVQTTFCRIWFKTCLFNWLVPGFAVLTFLSLYVLGKTTTQICVELVELVRGNRMFFTWTAYDRSGTLHSHVVTRCIAVSLERNKCTVLHSPLIGVCVCVCVCVIFCSKWNLRNVHVPEELLFECFKRNNHPSNVICYRTCLNKLVIFDLYGILYDLHQNVSNHLRRRNTRIS